VSVSSKASPVPTGRSFHFAAGSGPVVEVRLKVPPTHLATKTLVDEVGSLLEVDFEIGTGAFAGLRLQSYHEVGQQRPSADLPEVDGLPSLGGPAESTKVSTPPLVCSKQLTAIDRGNLLLNWSGALNFDQTSILRLKSGNGFVQGSLRAYYLQGKLVAFRLEDVPVTLFNELPHFSAPGR